MPAFNAARTIRQAIDSVLQQSHSSLELLVVDDASTDETVAVVQGFSDRRIRLTTNAVNEGPGPCRDAAISEARGQWVTILDADDLYAPTRIESLLRVAQQYPKDIVIDNVVDCHDIDSAVVPWRTVWDQRRFTPKAAAVREVDLPRFLQETRLLIKPFVSRELIARCGAKHGSSRNGEDLAFLYPLFAAGSVIRYVPISTYLYRMTPGSLSTTNPDRHRMYREVFENARALFAADPRALAAIDARLVQLNRVQTYQLFFSALQQKQWERAIESAWSHPWIIGEFSKRVMQRLPLHLHRLLHGGQGRTIE